MPEHRLRDEDIDTSIKAMVKDGLNERVQHVLDLVRVLGNHAVHPGEIDLSGDRPTAVRVLDFINFITDEMISKPKRIKEMVTGLPERDRKKVEGRTSQPGHRPNGNEV